MVWRARYFLIGGIAIFIAAGLIGWHVWGGRGNVLNPDGGPVVTVMDFGRSFPLDPAAVWLTPSEILDPVADGNVLCGQGWGAEHAVRNHDSASMLFRSVDINLAAYPMLRLAL